MQKEARCLQLRRQRMRSHLWRSSQWLRCAFEECPAPPSHSAHPRQRPQPRLPLQRAAHTDGEPKQFRCQMQKQCETGRRGCQRGCHDMPQLA